MKKKHFLLVLLCISLFLNGIVLFYFIMENRGISQEEAENIALKQAESDGFLSPTLWERFNTESTLVYEYSVERREDVRSWKVQIETENNPAINNAPVAIYFISHDNGEIIRVINGLE